MKAQMELTKAQFERRARAFIVDMPYKQMMEFQRLAPDFADYTGLPVWGNLWPQQVAVLADVTGRPFAELVTQHGFGINRVTVLDLEVYAIEKQQHSTF